ncbi:PIN domain-containing protein [bacterium]|nr:PIN domain-containing protein [bacterium]MBU1958349.1 PIN domain-containing protein [bacterium]
MSFRVYIDTNVFLDSYLKRDNGFANRVFSFLENREIEIYLNDISIINIAYILKKEFSNDEIKEKIDFMTKQYNVICASSTIIEDANNSDFKDFEDGVQYFCAKKIKADLIISRNKKDFETSDIDVLKPNEFTVLYIDE